MEKLVLRTEYDPYMAMEKYIAIFPGDSARPGYLAFVSFYFDRENRAIFEPYGELSFEYYYNSTKQVRKNTEDARRCCAALENYYNTTFKLYEKVF